MKLSRLQRSILKEIYTHGSPCPRVSFNAYYSKVGDQEIKVITVSLERLIAKGLLKGYGYKTAEKLFIQKATLTPKGVKEIKRVIDEGQRLPLKKSQKK